MMQSQIFLRRNNSRRFQPFASKGHARTRRGCRLGSGKAAAVVEKPGAMKLKKAAEKLTQAVAEMLTYYRFPWSITARFTRTTRWSG